MGKHFNEKYEAIIHSDFGQVHLGKEYNVGDKVPQKEFVKYVSYTEYLGNRLEKIILNRDLIIDLYNQITEIEKNTREVEYTEFDNIF